MCPPCCTREPHTIPSAAYHTLHFIMFTGRLQFREYILVKIIHLKEQLHSVIILLLLLLSYIQIVVLRVKILILKKKCEILKLHYISNTFW